MSACVAVLLAAAWLAVAPAQVSAEVHAAVIFTRTGERTPLVGVLGVPELSPLGAIQAYDQGSLFRQRYVTQQNNSLDLSGPARIQNISEYSLMNDQIYVLAPDNAFTGPTAQAFLQGLYPPFSLNRTAAPSLDVDSILANSSYIEAPLDGYQYPRIRTVSTLDPNIVFLAGQANCLNNDIDRNNYYFSAEFNETLDRTESFYHQVGIATLSNLWGEGSYSYVNAYVIYDYLNYQYMHDASIRSILSNNITLRGAFDQLRYLADQQQWALNTAPDSSSWIRAIAGKTLAAKILGQLAVNINTDGANAKLSLMFGEFEPMLSFFSLASLAKNNASNFYGLPDYASSMVFELYSMGDSGEAYPSQSDLWVRFYFRNGTSDDSELVAYPLFGHGPSETSMRWQDFEVAMSEIMLDGVGDWCDSCAADSIFCPAFTNFSWASMSSTNGDRNMPPAVAGVIGAGVTLGVTLLAVAAAMLLGGVRFHRRGDSVIGAGTRRKSSLGGFKGSAKLASDADVSFANKGAPFGVSVTETQQKQPEEAEPGKPRERVGSWEMSDGKHKNYLSGSTVAGPTPPAARGAQVESRRSSLDIYEDAMARPVDPHERV